MISTVDSRRLTCYFFWQKSDISAPGQLRNVQIFCAEIRWSIRPFTYSVFCRWKKKLRVVYLRMHASGTIVPCVCSSWSTVSSHFLHMLRLAANSCVRTISARDSGRHFWFPDLCKVTVFKYRINLQILLCRPDTDLCKPETGVNIYIYVQLNKQYQNCLTHFLNWLQATANIWPHWLCIDSQQRNAYFVISGRL